MIKLTYPFIKNKIFDILKHPYTWIGFSILSVLTLCFVLFSTHEEKVTVSDTLWHYTYRIEKYKIRMYEDFYPPKDAFDIRYIGDRIHHYNRVWSHTEHYYVTESYSCGTSCSGSGSSKYCSSKTCYRSVLRTREVYKSVPVYKPYYAYKAWRWDFERNVIIEEHNSLIRAIDEKEFGLNLNLNPGEKERFSRKDEYSIIFSSIDDKWDYSMNSQKEFIKYKTGMKLTIVVNNLGSILDAGFGE